VSAADEEAANQVLQRCAVRGVAPCIFSSRSFSPRSIQETLNALAAKTSEWAEKEAHLKLGF
jgi:hypothetical protein